MSRLYITPVTADQRYHLFTHFQNLELTQKSFDYMCHDMGFKTPRIVRKSYNKHLRVHSWKISFEDGPNYPSFVIYTCPDLFDAEASEKVITDCIINFKPVIYPMEFKYPTLLLN